MNYCKLVSLHHYMHFVGFRDELLPECKVNFLISDEAAYPVIEAGGGFRTDSEITDGEGDTLTSW